MVPPMMNTARLQGRRAIITGGARGIGGAIAAALAVEGARVCILDRLVEPGQRHAAAIGGSFLDVDLADPAATRLATASAIDTLGGVDILINSAGIFRLEALLDVSIESWDQMFDINTRAALLTMQGAATAMIAAGDGGRIINIASMAAKSGGAMEGHYAASKAALVALTRSAALEWGEHGITANTLCPGYILTEMGAATRTEEDIARWSAKSPLGRLGTPEDVAAVAVFLATRDASYVTGQAINVTGGMIMH
jgi:3-oxoacyl-[acyl-carrier protein] reductase